MLEREVSVPLAMMCTSYDVQPKGGFILIYIMKDLYYEEDIEK